MYILLRSVNLRLSVLILSPVLCTTTLLALGERPTEDETNSLKQLSLAELGNLQVTTANKTPFAENYWEFKTRSCRILTAARTLRSRGRNDASRLS